MNRKLFDEMDAHLSEDEIPSQYINRIAVEPVFRTYPFNMLLKMKNTEQSPVHHPEGNVWNHTMLVLDYAAQIKSNSHNLKVFMWTALLHDIGKPDTTKIRKGKITSYDHDKLGAMLAEKFLRELTEDIDFIGKVVALVRWHMQILFVVNKLPFADIRSMKHQVDISEVALIGLCDRMGRKGADLLEEEKNILAFLERSK